MSESRRVRIDAELCTGQGRCYRLAPAIFEPDADAKGVVKLEVVGPEHAEDLDKAVRLCPEEAISVEPA